jgi:hypothetical protein
VKNVFSLRAGEAEGAEWGLWSSGLCEDGRTGEPGLSGGFEGRI